MDSNLSVRPLDNKDSKDVINLILPIQQIEFNVPVTLEDQPDLIDIDKFYHSAGGCFWGAFSEGRLIGTIALIDIGHHSGAIRKMFVEKESRGKKTAVAQTLLDTLLGYAQNKGIIKILLGTVPVLTAAQRFYERNGFKKIEAGALPPYFPRMKADTIFYCYES